MATKLIHKNSKVQFKNATGAQLEFGELAINYHASGPYLQAKGEDGEVHSLGGVYIGSSAPSNPLPGRWWFDDANSKLFLYDGSAWQIITGSGGGGSSTTVVGGDGIVVSTSGSTATVAVDLASSANGLLISSGKLQAHIATASDLGTVKIGDGIDVDAAGEISVDLSGIDVNADLDYTAAVDKGTVTNTAGDDATIPIADATNAGLFTAAEKAKLAGLPVTVGETPPSTPADGDLWWNSSDDSGRLYVYYDEGPGGSQQWVEASPQGDTLTESDADTLYLTKVSDDTAEGAITFEKLTTHEDGVKVTGGTIDLTSANGEIAYGTDPSGLTNTLQIKGTNGAHYLRLYEGGVQLAGENLRSSIAYGGIGAFTKYSANNTQTTTFIDNCNYANVGDRLKTSFNARPKNLTFAPGYTIKYIGFYALVAEDTTSGNNLAYGFYSDGAAPSFFSGDTYIGGTTARNTRELWEFTLTEEQKEQLEAGTLVAPANVSTPGDGSFARQWWYDQQSAEDQALIDSGELDYPSHFQAANFVDTFALGDNTAINLLSNGRGEFGGGVKVAGGSDVSDVTDGGCIYQAGSELKIVPSSTGAVVRCNVEGSNSHHALRTALPPSTGKVTNIGIRCDNAVTQTNSDSVTSAFYSTTSAATGGKEFHGYKFIGSSNLTSSDVNAGFYSAVAIGDNSAPRYNFYAAEDAPNYFAGNLTIASSPDFLPSTATSGSGCSITALTSTFARDDASSNKPAVWINRIGNNSGYLLRGLFDGASSSICGIAGNGTGGIQFFQGASDYRVKENVISLPNATETIKALRPVEFNFIDYPDKVDQGFIAHELQEHISNAVRGEKDATEAIGTLADYDGTELETDVVEPSAEELEYTEEVETDGVATMVTRTRTWTPTGTRPVYQGVDQTKLIPLLVKSLQEALERIEALEAQVNS